ncbi:MAG TPA: hypothetical protein VMM18_08090 [Gemmatimonadaceae bacterium]|nr:hypothetical protein [Gemmatimonadaceae bacterium]
MSGRRLAAFAGSVGLCLACAEIGPAGRPASIAFEDFPAPAVVAGDTLRDISGAAVPLRASVLDARNNPVPDAAVRFIAIDDGLLITDDHFVIGETAGESVRIFAEVDGLQTGVVRLDVTRRPDEVRGESDPEEVLEYVPPLIVTSDPFTVRVLHRDPSAPLDSVVPRYIVRFEVVGMAPGDTVPGYLVDERGIRSLVDTTDAEGLAARRFRLNPATLQELVDTLEIRAAVDYRGEPVAGSPVSFLLIIRPTPAS